MIDKQHCKIRYEQGFWEELDPFYDFSLADKNFVATIGEDTNEANEASMDVDVDDDDDDDDGGWEDVSDGEAEGDEEEVFEGYEREIRRFGLKVNALGELVFPDGRVVGHRALRRYYKQKITADTTKSLAIVVVPVRESWWPSAEPTVVWQPFRHCPCIATGRPFESSDGATEREKRSAKRPLARTLIGWTRRQID